MVFILNTLLWYMYSVSHEVRQRSGEQIAVATQCSTGCTSCGWGALAPVLLFLGATELRALQQPSTVAEARAPAQAVAPGNSIPGCKTLPLMLWCS